MNLHDGLRIEFYKVKEQYQVPARIRPLLPLLISCFFLLVFDDIIFIFQRAIIGLKELMSKHNFRPPLRTSIGLPFFLSALVLNATKYLTDRLTPHEYFQGAIANWKLKIDSKWLFSGHHYQLNIESQLILVRALLQSWMSLPSPVRSLWPTRRRGWVNKSFRITTN